MSEDKARILFRQVISAVSYCHDQRIIHRDIKGENILLDEHMNVKLIDFGLATFYKENECLEVPCGSPNYAAPEVLLKRKYKGPEVDIWSLGVVFYILVCGFLPFHAPDFKSLVATIMTGEFALPEYLSQGYFPSKFYQLHFSFFVSIF